MSVAGVEVGEGTCWAGLAPPALRRHPVSQSTKRLKLLQKGADAIAISVAFSITYLSRSTVPTSDFDPSRRQLVFCALFLPVWLVVFTHYRLYAARTIASRVEECSRLLRAVAVSAGLMAALSYVIRLEASRSLVLGSSVLAFSFCLAERQAMRAFFRRLRTTGRLRRRAVVIGSNGEAQSLARMLLTTPHLGYHPVGLCGDDVGEESCVPWLGPLSAASEVVAAAEATTAVVVTTSLRAADVNRVVRRLHDLGVHIELSAGLIDIPGVRLSVRDLDRHAVLYLEPTVHGGWRAAAKRGFDLCVSIPTLVLAAPVMVVSAIVIKLTSSGPLLFHQERIGKGGVPFQMHKLRTMVDGADAMVADLTDRNEADWPLFKVRDDPRVTPVGVVLRRLSIDELPQLWNVVRGEMSLVGPRPALSRELIGWTSDLHNRLRVKPGVTGMWQVSGRSDASFDDYVRHDLFYVDNWSLMRDLAIFAKTIPTVMFRRGAC